MQQHKQCSSTKYAAAQSMEQQKARSNMKHAATLSMQ
jgi:hypothetical protein